MKFVFQVTIWSLVTTVPVFATNYFENVQVIAVSLTIIKLDTVMADYHQYTGLFDSTSPQTS